jgi:hypothetical protein
VSTSWRQLPEPARSLAVAVADGGAVGHAPILIADLLAGSGGRLGGYLDGAFADIARAELMEQP